MKRILYYVKTLEEIIVGIVKGVRPKRHKKEWQGRMKSCIELMD